MELKWTILCFLGAVLILGNSLNWMAGGNFTQEEFAILRAKVDNFYKGKTISNMATGAKTMSDELNDLWKPAWNAVIVYYVLDNFDSVVYGYAFNNRWFWQNGLQLTNGDYFCIIIWKDFNCVAWYTLDSYNSDPNYSKDVYVPITDHINNHKSSRLINDIWKVAQDVQDKLIGADPNLLQDKLAYTIVASQSSNIVFSGRFCVEGYMIVTRPIGVTS